MENKIRILLAESTAKYQSEFISNLDREPDIQLIGKTADGFELLDMVNELKPDAVVMGLVLDRLDGLSVLSRLRQLPDKPKILVISTWGTMMEAAAAMGADFFIYKPCNARIVCERIRQLTYSAVFPEIPRSAVLQPAAPQPRETAFDREKLLTSILLELGVPAHVRGFKYLRQAILIAFDDPKTMESVTKTLYPSVARRFEAPASYVERGIRHAISIAWEHSDPKALEKYFGHTHGKPTNSEFIAVMCECLPLNYPQLNLH